MSTTKPKLEGSLPLPNGRYLTPTEVKVLKLLSEGWTNQQAADKLGISIKTLEKHRNGIGSKTGYSSGCFLAHLALYLGITQNVFSTGLVKLYEDQSLVLFKK